MATTEAAAPTVETETMTVEEPKKVTKEKKPKAPKEKKTKQSKTAAAHPPYFQMIKEALLALNDKSGSSPYAIAKYMEGKHKAVLPGNFKKILALQLKNSAAKGKLIKIKASYKLSESGKKDNKKTATTTKPTVAPKPAATTQKRTRSATKTIKPETAAKKQQPAKKAKKSTPAKPKQPKSIKSPAAKKAKKATAAA